MGYIEKWRSDRHEEVKSTFGDLALQSLIEINEQQTVEAIPGVWKPNVEKGTGLIACFNEQDAVSDENGAVVNGDIALQTDESVVAIDSSRYAMATAQPGSPYLLAIYNKEHEALTRYSHIANYDYNPDHIYIGKYKQTEDDAFLFQHTGDMKNGRHEAGRKHQSNAIIEVDIEAVRYELRPFASGSVNIVVFRDLTCDQETYSVGRMIVVEELDEDLVKLDFNKAFLPPCAFSPHFNCPMPPFSNRIKTELRAGEKNVIWNEK